MHHTAYSVLSSKSRVRTRVVSGKIPEAASMRDDPALDKKKSVFFELKGRLGERYTKG